MGTCMSMFQHKYKDQSSEILEKGCRAIPASVQPIKRRLRPAVPIQLDSFVKSPKVSEENVKAELGF